MSDNFALSRGHLTMSGDLFFFHDYRDGCAIDIERGQTRDAAKHLKINRMQQRTISPTC